MIINRQELTNAERLFDLPITTYPNLVKVQNEMKGLEQIYALYEEQKNAREEWAQTLWANLNVNLVCYVIIFIDYLIYFSLDFELLQTLS